MKKKWIVLFFLFCGINISVAKTSQTVNQGVTYGDMQLKLEKITKNNQMGNCFFNDIYGKKSCIYTEKFQEYIKQIFNFKSNDQALIETFTIKMYFTIINNRNNKIDNTIDQFSALLQELLLYYNPKSNGMIGQEGLLVILYSMYDHMTHMKDKLKIIKIEEFLFENSKKINGKYLISIKDILKHLTYINTSYKNFIKINN